MSTLTTCLFQLIFLFLAFNICIGWEGQIVFSEDFDGNSLRKHYWDYEDSCEGKGNRDTNLECFRKGTNNVLVENGSLVITARHEVQKQYMMGDYKQTKMQYTSGKIIQSGFGFSYGTYVIRARFPKGKHLLPSIYLTPLGQRENTCHYEEIDIFQARGQRPSTIILGAHHGRTYKSAASKTFEKVFRDKDFSRDFHEFAVNWTPTRIEWYVDNKKVYEVSTHYVSDWTNLRGDNLPTCQVSKKLFSQRSMLVISLSVGGYLFPETKYGKLSPTDKWDKPTLEIDWIKVHDPKNVEVKQKLTVFKIPGIDGLDLTF